MMWTRAVVAVVALTLSAQSAAPPIFTFTADEFWLNLHHFLYVLGRAQMKDSNNSRPAVAGAPQESDRGLETLSAAERQVWAEAIAFYFHGPGRKDLVFDDPLPRTSLALASAGDSATLADRSIDAAWGQMLERAAPVYRKAWWPAHRAANVARQKELQELAGRHGPKVLAFITRAYEMPWPAEGRPVHLSGYANWAGAYSTQGNLLVVSSRDRALAGLAGLETVFHEGMHQWDTDTNGLIYGEVRRLGKRLPPNLAHAMIFFTAGEAVRRVSPAHVPYADANGVWERGFQLFKTPLEEVWKPYLEGTGTRDQAIAALVERVAQN
jgi:hypothetical protein